MRGISKRRGTLALTAIIILITSIAASTVYFYGSNFISNEAPQVQVASLDNGEVLPAGVVEIKGAAADDGTVRAVSIRVDGGSPTPVVPTAKDFSSWSIVLDLGPGNHTIEIETVDDSGQTNSKEISVVATDAAFDMPADMVIEASGPSGAPVDYALPTIQEGIKISEGPDCLPAPGSMFPIGITTVACTISFAGGTTASHFQVSVVDITPPTIRAPADITVENSGVAFVKPSLGKPDVDDDIDASPTVRNNAPAHGFALGTTLVVWTAEDDQGNVARASQKVTVTGLDDREIIEKKDEDNSVTYSGGGGGGSSNSGRGGSVGGGGGGGSSNSGGASPPPQHTLTINAQDLSGEPIAVSVTVKATNGTILQTGSTPQTFVGTSLTYEIFATQYDEARFDHWENGAANTTRQVTLKKDVTIVAYYNTSGIESDTVAPTLTATPAGGTYSSARSVTLAASEPATIYYTTNGNDPTTSSAVYSSPILITSSTTLKYIAKDTAGNSGNVVTQVYTIDTLAPIVTANPIGGSYSSIKTVTLSSNEAATIYYTINGNTPTTSSSTYSSSITIAATTTLKYFARDAAGNSGNVGTQVYIIDKTAPSITVSPPAGTYSSPQSVTLTANEPATIYYTINGNNPTTSSTVYSSPINIASTTTLKYFGKDSAGNSGSIATQTYTINAADTTVPTIEITNFDDGSAVAMPVGGLITVQGTASDNQGGSGIEVVEVRVDDGSYVEATPAAQGDWSSWSVTLQVTAGERRLVPRVTDNAGNQAWNSIYVTFTAQSGGGGGGGGSDTLDDFGIEKLYPTTDGGNEWYVNMADPYSDPLLQNRETLTKQPDGSWQVSGGSNGQVRLEAWSPSNEKWLNVEITMYAKMVSGSNELLQMYSRGGHHTSSNECLGSAYKARFYGDGDAAWVKEVNHPAYAGNRGSVQATNDALADRWIGLKAVIYNFVENGKTYVRMESYIDDDVTDSNGNLVIGNNWELASVVEDRGDWTTNDSDFNATCAPVDVDSTEQYRQRDEILSMPGGTSTQNIAAFRSDGLTWNWKYLTVREIVPPS